MPPTAPPDLIAVLGEAEAAKLEAEIENTPFDVELAAQEMWEMHGQDCGGAADKLATAASEQGQIETAEIWAAVAKYCRDEGLDQLVFKEPSRELLATTARIAGECAAAGYDPSSGDPPSPELQARIDEITREFHAGRATE